VLFLIGGIKGFIRKNPDSFFRKITNLVSALFMCMFQVQEEELNTAYEGVKENRNAKMLLSMMEDMYKK